MKQLAGNRFSLIAFTFFLVVNFNTPTSGQEQGGIAANPLGPFTSSIERRRAEQDLRALPVKLKERRVRNLSDPRILKQMNEDFVRLQTIRADIVKVFGSGLTVEPEVLKEAAGEVKRRSTRLRSLLALSENFADQTIEAEKISTIESVNDRAFLLCVEISRFTENPLFKASGVITIKHANEASGTLDTIIALAAVLQRESDRLAKN